MMPMTNDGNFGNCARLLWVQRVPLRHEPEQTGTVDLIVLKELRLFLFRVPVLSALFDGRALTVERCILFGQSVTRA